MKSTETIIKMLNQENKSQKWLSEQMGYARSTSLSTILRNGNITINNMIKMCNILGYDIIIKPRDGTNKAERTLTIDEVSK